MICSAFVSTCLKVTVCSDYRDLAMLSEPSDFWDSITVKTLLNLPNQPGSWKAMCALRDPIHIFEHLLYNRYYFNLDK